MKKYLFGILISILLSTSTHAIDLSNYIGGCDSESSIDSYLIEVPFSSCLESNVHERACIGSMYISLLNKCSNIYRYTRKETVNNKDIKKENTYLLFNGVFCKEGEGCDNPKNNDFRDSINEEYGIWIKKVERDNWFPIYLVGINLPKGTTVPMFVYTIPFLIFVLIFRKQLHKLWRKFKVSIKD